MSHLFLKATEDQAVRGLRRQGGKQGRDRFLRVLGRR